MCDSLVARGARTADGATLFAKNSDRRGREAQPFVQIPAAYHPRGARVRCTHIAIDQVAETYRVMGHSPEWCWGFEQGVNEHGVAIGNHATWSREPLELAAGLIGMDLVRLGLERGRDAREALEVIASLLETHGQGGSSFGASGDDGYQNSFVIADGRAAWVLETTARGWAARAVESAGLTNALTLGRDWQIGSRDLERRATQQGFWHRDGRLDFKAAYGVESWPTYLTDRRRQASTRCLDGPALTLGAMKGWLRDHAGQTLPPDARRESVDPDRYSVCMHAEPVSMTTASMVVRLPAEIGHRPWPVWISFATPCTGIFVPVYLDGTIPRRFARPPGSAEASGVGPAHSAWEALRRLQERATSDFERTMPIVHEGWKELERAIELDRLRVEQEVAVAYDDRRYDEGERALTLFMEEMAERLVDQANRLTASL